MSDISQKMIGPDTVVAPNGKPMWRPDHEINPEQDAILRFVYGYRLDHPDHGPTWREVAEHLQWDWHWKSPQKQKHEATIRFLVRGRWLKGARKERGLNLGWRGRQHLETT